MQLNCKMLPPPRSTPAAFAVALSWFGGLWEDPEDPPPQDPEVAEKKVPDEDVISDLVLSISDDSGLRDGVDGGTGSLQEGQLHGASRRNSDSLLMPEHLLWHHCSQTDHRNESHPPATLFPQTLHGSRTSGPGFSSMSPATLRRRRHTHQATWWM